MISSTASESSRFHVIACACGLRGRFPRAQAGRRVRCRCGATHRVGLAASAARRERCGRSPGAEALQPKRRSEQRERTGAARVDRTAPRPSRAAPASRRARPRASSQQAKRSSARHGTGRERTASPVALADLAALRGIAFWLIVWGVLGTLGAALAGLAAAAASVPPMAAAATILAVLCALLVALGVGLRRRSAVARWGTVAFAGLSLGGNALTFVSQLAAGPFALLGALLGGAWAALALRALLGPRADALFSGRVSDAECECDAGTVAGSPLFWLPIVTLLLAIAQAGLRIG